VRRWKCSASCTGEGGTPGFPRTLSPSWLPGSPAAPSTSVPCSISFQGSPSSHIPKTQLPARCLWGPTEHSDSAYLRETSLFSCAHPNPILTSLKCHDHPFSHPCPSLILVLVLGSQPGLGASQRKEDEGRTGQGRGRFNPYLSKDKLNQYIQGHCLSVREATSKRPAQGDSLLSSPAQKSEKISSVAAVSCRASPLQRYNESCPLPQLCQPLPGWDTCEVP
jgi:hypothetical protein